MKYLATYENYAIREFFDFEKYFSIGESDLPWIFDDLLMKFPYLGFELVEVNKSVYKIEIFDKEPRPKDNLEDELQFLKSEESLHQLSGQFDMMDCVVKSVKLDTKKNRIVLKIRKLKV